MLQESGDNTPPNRSAFGSEGGDFQEQNCSEKKKKC